MSHHDGRKYRRRLAERVRQAYRHTEACAVHRALATLAWRPLGALGDAIATLELGLGLYVEGGAFVETARGAKLMGQMLRATFRRPLDSGGTP